MSSGGVVVQRLFHRVAALAEPALRERDLLVRPIPFFERLDRFRRREQEWTRGCEPYLAALQPLAAQKVARTWAFSNELCREVLQGFCPDFPWEGENALCTLWAAAVLLDHLLDDELLEPAFFEPIRSWVKAQAGPEFLDPDPPSARFGLGPLGTMLRDLLADCRRRADRGRDYRDFHAQLLRLLDAELRTPRLTLEAEADESLRSVLWEKSTRLCWVGFRAGSLGAAFEPAEQDLYRALCDAVGEVLWVMDDLADVEEDMDRRVWNRTLWRLHDAVGADRFAAACVTAEGLADLLEQSRVVEEEIHEIGNRVEFLESHVRDRKGGGMRAMLSFWITSWLGIYS